MRTAYKALSISLVVSAVFICGVVAKPEQKPGDRPPQPSAAQPGVSEDGITVYFSPGGGALAAIASRIDGARGTLDVQAYILSTERLARPIANAHKRGVKVRVLLDADHVGPQYSGATYLANAGLPVMLDHEHKEAHNKVMLIDGRTIITGSFNFTLAADIENAENVLVIEDKPKLFKAYLKNFEDHLRHAKAYERVR